MQIKHGFVRFGCMFESIDDARGSDQRIIIADGPYPLHRNTLVTDVGAVCWGVDREERSIIDHHFVREGQFPSAAAAVLHLAPKIYDRFANSENAVWLLTHIEPDFDALCSTYLARGILTGTVPHDGWEDVGLNPVGWTGGKGEINWRDPRVSAIDPSRQWPILLASVAAHVDQCWPMHCPRSRALQSVLYAAMRRGRDYTGIDAATAFFDEVVRCISGSSGQRDGLLNPLWDSVLEDSREFAPELSLLEREADVYLNDLKRGRKVTVFLPDADQPFDAWYGDVSRTPLLDDTGFVDDAQLTAGTRSHAAVDGFFIRDPECIMFKEWARHDTENAPGRQGFLFTAVAYSVFRSNAPVNGSRYIISIDPERAGRRNLYSVWARLQAAEIHGLQHDCYQSLREHRLANPQCRKGYEERAVFERQSGEAWYLMDDPWYDGANYDCTIIDTPSRGTSIGPEGVASDLSDDHVATIVREELEMAVFSGDIMIYDDSLTASSGDQPTLSTLLTQGGARTIQEPKDDDAIRFCQVMIHDGIDLLSGSTAEQIGTTLWRLLDRDHTSGVPTDFVERHLLVSSLSVGIWNRRGMVIATKPSAVTRAMVDDYRESVRQLARIKREFTAMLRCPRDSAASPANAHAATQPAADELSQTIERQESLLQDVVRLRDRFSVVDRRMLRRYFNATGIEDMLSSLTAMNSATSERLQNQTVSQHLRSMVRTQHVAEIIEYIIVGVYTLEFWHNFAPGWLGGTDHGSHAEGSAPPKIADHTFSLVTYGGWNFGVLLAFLVGLGLADLINYLVFGNSPLANLLLTKLGLKKNDEYRL